MPRGPATPARRIGRLAPALSSVLAFSLLAACSSQEAERAETPERGKTAQAPQTSATGMPSDLPRQGEAGPRALRLEGLGDLTVGEPVPSGSSFASRGAQIPGSDCTTVSSPDYPGVYAMVIGDQVRRITVGGQSDVTLSEGIGVGASEADVLAAFPSFDETPHKYINAPAKYLIQPGSDPRLRFEIAGDGRVGLIHVGLMPELGYVEGCA